MVGARRWCSGSSLAACWAVSSPRKQLAIQALLWLWINPSFWQQARQRRRPCPSLTAEHASACAARARNPESLESAFHFYFTITRAAARLNTTAPETPHRRAAPRRRRDALSWACPTPAGTTCPPGTAGAQTTPPGRSSPPGTAQTTSARRRSGPWGTGRTPSCRRTSRRCPARTWSARTCPAGRTCSRWGRASGPSSWGWGSRRATGTQSCWATWAGTWIRRGNQTESKRPWGSRSPPGKASGTRLRCRRTSCRTNRQGRATAHETFWWGRGSRSRNHSTRHRRPRGAQPQGWAGRIGSRPCQRDVMISDAAILLMEEARSKNRGTSSSRSKTKITKCCLLQQNIQSKRYTGLYPSAELKTKITKGYQLIQISVSTKHIPPTISTRMSSLIGGKAQAGSDAFCQPEMCNMPATWAWEKTWK